MPKLRALVLAVSLVAVGAFLPPAAAEDTYSSVEKGLADPEASERVKALALLDGEKKGPRAEKLALRGLKDLDWGVQIKACSVLAKVGGPDSIPVLGNIAVDGEIQWVRDAATESMKKIDAEAAGLDLLEAAAKATRDEAQRARAIDAAGRMERKAAFGRLAGYAKSKEIVVSAAAVRALGRLAGEAELRKEFLDVMDDALDRRGDKKHYFAFVAAIEAMGKIDDAAARERLVKELIMLPDDDLHAQERIARALEPQDPAAVAVALRGGFAEARKPEELRRVVRLAARLKAKDVRPELEKFLTHADERVRSEAARGLGRIADPASAAALRPVLEDQKASYARMEAVTSLARTLTFDQFLQLAGEIQKDTSEVIRLQFVVELADLGKPEGIAVLKMFLTDPSWRVASAAAATVGTLGIGDDLPLLVPLAGDKNWKIRAAALEGMARLRAAAAIPHLVEGLGDKDPVVKGVCHSNLQILSREKFGPEPATWKSWWEKNKEGLAFVKKSRSAEPKKPSDDRYAAPTKEAAVEILQKARILVVIGAWDKVQNVLGHLDVKHTLLRAQELKSAGLNPNQILLVNCEGNMDKDTLDRVRWFVNVGGYLMTTDWALTKTVEPGFPGYVKQFSGSSTGNDVVVVEDARPGHRFTAGVFDNVPALQWWLEIQAFPMQIMWPERCEVIVDSAEMRQRYGSSPMACTFRWGLGKVQHSLSHFYLQEEGLQQASDPRKRMIFAADNLGLSLEQIRRIAKDKGFEGQLNEETMKKIAPDYSMFRLIVNVVREKADWVENL